VIHRVFRIHAAKAGTAFTVDEGGKQYLVTAKHVVSGLVNSDEIGLFSNGEWKRLGVRLVGHATDDVDISALAPDRCLTPEGLPLPASADGLIYGQDVHFLGFPYTILPRYVFGEGGYPMPLVKRATVSAFDQELFLLDGHNNPGFSGGPVVFARQDGSGLNVAAVVSNFQAVDEPILRDGAKTDLVYEYNTGIIVAYNVDLATKLIRNNPVGCAM
jgi:S1-C subfamily serine protease